ncbi:MAG: GNAT family N-acetyltransferase [Caldilineaceae bacterium]
MLHIRPLTNTDITPLAHLMATTPLWQRYGVTEANATARLQSGLTAQETIAVAEAAGIPTGFVWYVARSAFQRGGYIMLIGVAATARSQGIGAALMAHAEATLFAQADSIFLLVSDFNAAAQRFYQRLGYQQIGAIPDFVLPGVSELIFYKGRRE